MAASAPAQPTIAIILAAGLGTRLLPITAAVQKALLPIGSRPLVDYIVADLVAGGIKHIIFVIRPGQTGLRDYYTGNFDYQQTLRRLGKADELAKLEKIHHQAKFSFAEQPESAGYGTAAAVLAAMPLLSMNEPVLITGDDDFIWHPDGTSETAGLIKHFTASQAAGAIMGFRLPAAELTSTGVLATKRVGDYEYLTDLVEKPAPGQAPSDLANISKYILAPDLLHYVSHVKPHASSGERYLTDAVSAAAAEHSIVVHRTKGTYLHVSTPELWLRANEIVTK